MTREWCGRRHGVPPYLLCVGFVAGLRPEEWLPTPGSSERGAFHLRERTRTSSTVESRAEVKQHVPKKNQSWSLKRTGFPQRSHRDGLPQLRSIEAHKKLYSIGNIDTSKLGLYIFVVCFLLGLVVMCCLVGKRCVVAYINKTLNPAARMALLNRCRGNEQSSMELYVEYAQFPRNPLLRRWLDEVSKQQVSQQIDITFDAFRGAEPCINKECAKRLIDSLQVFKGERTDTQSAWVEYPRIQPTDTDLDWLFGNWNDYFPSQINRKAYQDFVRLLLTWMLSRQSAYYLVVNRGIAFYAANGSHVNENYTTIKIVASGKVINVLQYSVDASRLSLQGYVSVQDNIGVREYKPNKPRTPGPKRKNTAAILHSDLAEDSESGGEDPGPRDSIHEA